MKNLIVILVLMFSVAAKAETVIWNAWLGNSVQSTNKKADNR